MKEPQGFISKKKEKATGKWVARVTYADPATGKRVDVKRRCETKTDARKALTKLLHEYQKDGAIEKVSEHLTFAEAAKQYSELKLTPAQYVDGRKVSGRRELSAPKAWLKVLIVHFGRKQLRNITHADLERFRLLRLQTPVVIEMREWAAEKAARAKAGRGQRIERIKKRVERPRSIRAVNAELQLMSGILNFSLRNGWLEKNPFHAGESLIRKADEHQRERTLSFEEEQRLLSVCVDERAHLRPLVICALDGGFRRGELLKLEWQDVNFNEDIIQVRPLNSKTGKERWISMTARMREELLDLQQSVPGDQVYVFPVRNNFKRAWRTACRLAGIADLHYHDLRHTFVSRAIEAGIPVPLAMRAAGHSSLAMLNRYTNFNPASMREVSLAIERINQQSASQSIPKLVN